MKTLSGRVLVVEDDGDTRQAVTDLLTHHGCDVVVAINGKDALRKLADRSAPLPSLILLDLWMPELDGWAFRAQQIADPLIRDIPVVVLSGDYRAGVKAIAAGCAAFLLKPVDPDTLLSTVARLSTSANIPTGAATVGSGHYE